MSLLEQLALLVSVGRFSGGVGRRLRLAAYLRLALPIVHIYSLGKVTKVGESGGLPDTGNLIFDAVGEAIIKVVPEGTFSITSDLRSNPIELSGIGPIKLVAAPCAPIFWRLERFVITQTAVLTYLGNHRKTLNQEKKSSINLLSSYALSLDIPFILIILLLRDLLRLLQLLKKL